MTYLAARSPRPRIRVAPPGAFALILFLNLSIPLSAQYALESPAHARSELIVLLGFRENVPAPEAVVDAVRRRRPLPAGLGVGHPEEADFIITRRARGSAAEAHGIDPEAPAAKLQRYIVLRYPASVNLEVVAEALERNPHVQWVGPVRYAEVSVEPDDPRFDDNPGGIPRPAEEHQWGSYALGLPDAWEFNKGHAYVGVIDVGIDADHEDLLALDAANNFLGGNYRPHLSWDYETDTNIVDDGVARNNHGTHVTGIVAATANNGAGVAGACWHCAVSMSQISATATVTDLHLVRAIEGTIGRGMQVLNMSFGYRPSQNPPNCSVDVDDPLCVALQLAEDREVAIAAASGNNATAEADWPSIDPRVLGAGGIESDGSFWDEGCSGPESCGANADPDQFVTPAKQVLSTFYLGLPSPTIGCSDSVDGTVDGYGPCTGTSMSSPYLAASAGILRSVNPLLSPDDVRALLVGNIENPPGWNPANGVGKPNVYQAVQDALGRVGGAVIDNRLTPLFQLYSFDAEDHVYTTSPQVATALKPGLGNDYRPTGLAVPGYDFFPGGNCLFVPCPAAASVYVFSGDRSPNGHPLVPLYRLSYEPPDPDPSTPENEDPNRDHTYTTEPAGIKAFADVGYRLDGVEGYIYERCSPEPSCIPVGATRLYRYYNATRDDWAIFPESELSSWVADGYSSQPGANPWIGYVYENLDSDGDWVIDGFEGLIGTNPGVADSDGDGLTDGQEILEFPYGDPLVPGDAQAIGEFGTVSLTHVGQTVVLGRSYSNPVVLAQPAGFNGTDVSVVRILDVQSDRFTVHIAEAPNHDGPHTTEQVSWIVLEAGLWSLPDGTPMEVGTLTTDRTVGSQVVDRKFAIVPYTVPFSTTPIVMSQVQTINDPSWVKTRQRAVPDPTLNFKVGLEPEEAQTTYHSTETIGWVALAPAVGTWSGHRYQAGSTGDAVRHLFVPVSFDAGASFSSPPTFVAWMATRNSGTNAAIRYTNLSASGVSVKVEQDTTFDPNPTHSRDETIHFLAIEGSGTLYASPR